MSKLLKTNIQKASKRFETVYISLKKWIYRLLQAIPLVCNY